MFVSPQLKYYILYVVVFPTQSLDSVSLNTHCRPCHVVSDGRRKKSQTKASGQCRDCRFHSTPGNSLVSHLPTFGLLEQNRTRGTSDSTSNRYSDIQHKVHSYGQISVVIPAANHGGGDCGFVLIVVLQPCGCHCEEVDGELEEGRRDRV